MHSDSTLEQPVEEAPEGQSAIAGLAGKVSRNKNRVVAFALLLVIASLTLGSLTHFWKSNFVLFIQVGGFLALGYLLALVLQANIALFTNSEKQLYALLLTVTVFVAVGSFYLFSPGFPLQTGLIASCAFLLPYTIAEAWRLFELLLVQAAPSWRYHPDLPLQKSTTFLNSIPIRFNVRVNRLGR
ncbi:MAG TPA: hypothetical protein VM871_09590, partial [Flavisolibacter sp.]|nr:hypothetical protein [Flavisolibacter sp.]